MIRRNTLQLWITDVGGSARGNIRFVGADIGWPSRVRDMESLHVIFEE